jgi:hypothetical protein
MVIQHILRQLARTGDSASLRHLFAFGGDYNLSGSSEKY